MVAIILHHYTIKKKIYLYYTILKKVKITTGFLHPVTQHLEENLENGRHLNFC